MQWLLCFGVAVLAGCDKPKEVELPAHGIEFITGDTWKGVEALVCEPARVDSCGPDGCNEGKVAINVRWEPQGVYKRCDIKGCDTYAPKVSYSGVWTNLAMPDHAMLAKIASDGTFIEAATINDTVLVYHGHCKRVKAP